MNNRGRPLLEAAPAVRAQARGVRAIVHPSKAKIKTGVGAVGAIAAAAVGVAAVASTAIRASSNGKAVSTANTTATTIAPRARR